MDARTIACAGLAALLLAGVACRKRTPTRPVPAASSGGSDAMRDAPANNSTERVTAIDAGARKPCPVLSIQTDDAAAVEAVRCIVGHDRPAELADSVQYPIEVLLTDGRVRVLRRPEELRELYGGMVTDDLRRAVVGGATERTYQGILIGRSVMLVSGMARKIGAIFNPDRGATERMLAKLSAANRSLWQAKQGDVVCRTRHGTHLFSADGEHCRLASWNDPKAVLAKRPPDRVLFGFIQDHGTCGNTTFRFLQPDGHVDFMEWVCFEYGQKYRYELGTEAGVEPCLNHPLR